MVEPDLNCFADKFYSVTGDHDLVTNEFPPEPSISLAQKNQVLEEVRVGDPHEPTFVWAVSPANAKYQ